MKNPIITSLFLMGMLANLNLFAMGNKTHSVDPAIYRLTTTNINQYTANQAPKIFNALTDHLDKISESRESHSLTEIIDSLKEIAITTYLQTPPIPRETPTFAHLCSLHKRLIFLIDNHAQDTGERGELIRFILFSALNSVLSRKEKELLSLLGYRKFFENLDQKIGRWENTQINLSLLRIESDI